MSLEATGAYLKRLREEARLSKLGLSRMVHTSDSQIIRIESGNETRGSLLANIIRVLGANPEDVVLLLSSDEYTAEDGVNLAEGWIKRRNLEHVSKSEIHPDVRELISRMTDYYLGRWVSEGKKLLEEQMKR
jgi:transcriptional regulator with XRE-family HTH domain